MNESWVVSVRKYFIVAFTICYYSWLGHWHSLHFHSYFIGNKIDWEQTRHISIEIRLSVYFNEYMIFAWKMVKGSLVLKMMCMAYLIFPVLFNIYSRFWHFAKKGYCITKLYWSAVLCNFLLKSTNKMYLILFLM